jgi:hypothetical protein
MSSRHRLWCWCVAVLLSIGAASSLFAQGTTSRVTGLVTDETGSIIPGAVVSLTNDDTGLTFTTTSTESGSYTFEAVQVGGYTLKVELSGFKLFVSTANRVAIGTTTTINAKLATGQVTETVQVTSNAPTVQVSDSGNLGSVLDQKSIEAMPIIGGRGRNPLDLVKTQPGVVSGANTGGGTHVHGARDRAWNFTLDGIDVNETSAGGANFAPLRSNPDSLAEFKILTGNFTAEYGRNSGGQVAMITRSGTNQFRGTGFYFARRPDFNANEWENNAQFLSKRQENIDISGFSLGGPIRRHKTFFFTNLQLLRAKREITVNRTVYTQTARQGLWRYSTVGRNQPAGVATASVDANGTPIVPIASYDIAANDPQRSGLDRTTQAIIAKTPLPNNFTIGDGLNTAGYTWKPIEEEKQHDFVAKVDQVLGTRHYAFARVGFGEQNTYCDNANGGLAPFPGVPCLVDTTRDPFNVAASWRWNPGSSFVNELVVGGNHFTFNFISPGVTPGLVDYSFGDITIPEGMQLGNARTINTFQIVNNTTYVRGAHSFKAGVNFRYQQHKDERGSVGSGNANTIINFDRNVNTVSSTAFNLPANIQTANDLPLLQNSINFLLGRVGSISQGFVARPDNTYAPGGTTFIFDARFPELDLFIQDNWKLRPNLTIDAGLRWEAKYVPRDPDNLTRRPNLRVAVGESPANALTWVQEPLYKSDFNNFGPSIGVAWDPKGNSKSVVRGNYRIAYDRIATFLFSSVVYQSIPGLTTTPTNTTFGQSGGRIPSAPSVSPAGTPADLATPPINSTGSIHVVDPEWTTPLTHGWSIGYQRELFNRTVVEVTYIGRKANNLYGAYNANQAEIRSNGFLDAFNVVRAGGQSTLINQLMANDTRRTAAETGSDAMRRLYAPELTLGSVGTVAQGLATRVQSGRTLAELAGLGPNFFYNYPQYLGGMNVLDTNDHSDYHALEMTLQRRFTQGFGYLLGYTLARSRDTRSFDPAFTRVSTGNAQSASSTPFDIYNRDLNFALSDFDRRHVFQGSFVTELPFGRGRRFGGTMNPALDAVVGGWQLAGIAVIQSGRPFTVYGGATTLSNVVQSPANCNGCSGSEGAVFDDPTGFVFYFNADERAKFSTAAPGQLGNTARNGFVGPNSFNLDMSLNKGFSLFGNHELQIRADATNLTNTATFNFPTAVLTSNTFGRIGRDVISSSRKVQLGVKYTF